ncbi:carbohydrate esterase family 1 protein [Zasmidium cellare ATCC 36951]|uniref:feruloyl esterase n=1 Tax=Zasmidium cellare ATCC 36951 TaxID=1080233 RepID=A0A6A6BYQ0_ZASCE|nr:carbohydrate esterase family 1 protein [Zasmidium cellare ATCC 36951]KAF2159733.1 carbohydrate esterase family 1 protein [Zasmidium cellare ATCC 36951]
MLVNITLIAVSFIVFATANNCDGSFPPGVGPTLTLNNVTLPSGRNFIYYLPQFYNGYNMHPAVFSFHGGARNATWQEDLTQLTNPYYNWQGISVYPQGAPRPSSDDDDDDDDDTGDTDADYQIGYWLSHPGKSNGGGLVNLLACNFTTASMFTAFASVSGAYYEDKLAIDGDPARDVPFLSFHGLNDTTIPYNGKPPKLEYSSAGELPKPVTYTGTFGIDDWLRKWFKINSLADSNGKVDVVNTTLYGGYVTQCVFGGPGSVNIIHYKENDLGHVWASLYPNTDCPSTNATRNLTKCPMGHYVFNATEVIIDYFNSFMQSGAITF